MATKSTGLHSHPAGATASDGTALASLDPITRATLADELRAPLAAIHSLADVIAEERFGGVANPTYRDYAESIRDAARHLIGVVESLLAPSHAEADDRPPASDLLVDLNSAAGVVHAMLVEIATRRSSRLTLDVAPALPLVFADRTAIVRIWVNLALNALRHAPLGADIALRTGREAGGDVWLEVEDDGPGLPPAIVEALCRRSGDLRATPKGDGTAGKTGLGLPMVRELAEANGARLSIPRAAATGTCIRLTFPPARQLPPH